MDARVPSVFSLWGVNLRHVKARLAALFRVLSQPLLGGKQDSLSFVETDRFLWGAAGNRPPGLHFHKRKGGIIGGNQVNFSPNAAPIDRQNFHALAFQALPHPTLSQLPQFLGGFSTHSFFKKVRRWMGQGPYSRSRA